MSGTHAILCCSMFRQEIETLKVPEKYPHVHMVFFPGTCGRPPVELDKMKDTLLGLINYAAVDVLGSICVTGPERSTDTLQPFHVHRMRNCFHMIANPDLVDKSVSEGRHLVTPGWLSSWRQHVSAWGFDQPTAQRFFAESAEAILMLDTGVDDAAYRNLQEFSEFVGRPYEVLTVGLDFLDLFVGNIVMQRQVELLRHEQLSLLDKTQKELAEYAMALDLLRVLTKVHDEDQVVSQIIDMFKMLFAPRTLTYTKEVSDISPAEEAIIRREKGFIVSMSADGRLMGRLELDDLQFPEYMDRYLTLASGLMDVCGMVLEKARFCEVRRTVDARIQHSQKLESLGVLAGGIAHDFNNLLTSILGYASVAVMRLPEDSPVYPMLQGIEKGSQRAAELTQQMLAYSGRGTFVIRPVRLDAVVQEMTTLLGTAVSKKATLSLHLEPAPVEGDATQLRQIVMNLITNASDALEGREGVISVRTGVRQADATVLRTPFLAETLPAGAYAYVEVTDTGCGMTEATRARIFDPFFTTKFTGRGLGLAAVLGIVKGHRGTITVDSTPGQGTVMQVLVPYATAVPAKEDVSGPTVSTWQGHGTVLVVDDEPDVRTFSRLVLESVGCQVREAGDGREGLELFGRHRQDIVAVLLDLTMPVMDGMETLVELRKLDSHVPVVVMSGYSASETSMRVVGLGASGFIQKPFHPRELIARVCHVLPAAGSTGGR